VQTVFGRSHDVCYNLDMEERVTIGQYGTITIPARLRETYGLKTNDELIIEPSDKGLLLRPISSEPIEIYTEERISEFASEEEAVGRLLSDE
jgi:AbrB family looped-hinge helix DNA binding protein